ncbi:MAG: DUF427 domain-containing protein [Solirubrobacteraceae bacterium]
MSATEPKLPGPDHPITLKPSPSRVVVSVGDKVVANSSRALEMHEAGHSPVLYLPVADLDQTVLEPSVTTSYCPYKGQASYHSVRTADGGLVPDAIWFYEAPYDAVAQIADHVAFYPDRVQIDIGQSR